MAVRARELVSVESECISPHGTPRTYQRCKCHTISSGRPGNLMYGRCLHTCGLQRGLPRQALTYPTDGNCPWVWARRKLCLDLRTSGRHKGCSSGCVCLRLEALPAMHIMDQTGASFTRTATKDAHLVLPLVAVMHLIWCRMWKSCSALRLALN